MTLVTWRVYGKRCWDEHNIKSHHNVATFSRHSTSFSNASTDSSTSTLQVQSFIISYYSNLSSNYWGLMSVPAILGIQTWHYIYIYLKTFNMDTQTLFSGVFMVTAQNGRTIASRIIQIKQYIHNTTTDTTQGWWLGVKTPGKDPRSKDPWFEKPRKLRNLPFNPCRAHLKHGGERGKVVGEPKATSHKSLQILVSGTQASLSTQCIENIQHGHSNPFQRSVHGNSSKWEDHSLTNYSN